MSHSITPNERNMPFIVGLILGFSAIWWHVALLSLLSVIFRIPNVMKFLRDRALLANTPVEEIDAMIGAGLVKSHEAFRESQNVSPVMVVTVMFINAYVVTVLVGAVVFGVRQFI
jgi:uncharacterized protein YybS (DUF2232 family)